RFGEGRILLENERRRLLVGKGSQPAKRRATHRRVGQQSVEQRHQVGLLLLEERLQGALTGQCRGAGVQRELLQRAQRLGIAEDHCQGRRLFADFRVGTLCQTRVRRRPAVRQGRLPPAAQGLVDAAEYIPVQKRVIDLPEQVDEQLQSRLRPCRLF